MYAKYSILFYMPKYALLVTDAVNQFEVQHFNLYAKVLTPPILVTDIVNQFEESHAEWLPNGTYCVIPPCPNEKFHVPCIKKLKKKIGKK